MNKQIFTITTLVCIFICSSYYIGVQNGRKQAYIELSETQGRLIKSKQTEKELLRDQIAAAEEQIRTLLANRAHENLLQIEAEERGSSGR